MTIDQAIAQYVSGWSASALRGPRAKTLGKALRIVFAPVLGEDLAILTAAQVAELRARLGRRGPNGGVLLGRVRELHWSATRTFIGWCVARRLLTRDPLGPRPVRHLGELAQRLREDAGLLRSDLAQQTGLPLPTLRQFENGRIPLSREQLLRLLAHPCMARLPDAAKAAGLGLGLGNNGVHKP
jgi:hypothetical protein